MRRLGLPAAWLSLSLAVPANAAPSQARLSEDLVEPEVAWAEPGFRVQLSMGPQFLWGQDKAPGGSGYAPAVHLGWRFGERLSLFLLLRYFIVSGGEMTGLRAAVTLEPTWQVWRGLSLGVGFGYTGLLASRQEQRYYSDRLLARLYAAAAENRDTPLPPFNACNGDGVAALARVSYLWPLGQLFATGGMAYVDESLVRCKDDYFVIWNAERTEVVRIFHQWWPQTSFGLAWVFAWR